MHSLLKKQKHLLSHENGLEGKKKDFEYLNTLCLQEQQKTWDQTNEIIESNHSVITNELKRARKIRHTVENACIEEKAKIQSIKHVDEFFMRRMKGFEKHYDRTSMQAYRMDISPDKAHGSMDTHRNWNSQGQQAVDMAHAFESEPNQYEYFNTKKTPRSL